MIETCCEARHDYLTLLLAESPRKAAEIMREIGAEDLLGRRLRGVFDDELSLHMDFRIHVGPIKQSIAKDFIREHHEHCRPPAGWRWGFGCWNGPTLIGVAMVGRPVARNIDPFEVVEVNRLCLDRTLPAALRHNVCSKMYGTAAKEARRRGYRKIITYTLASESGGSLRAAGWQEDGHTKGGRTWSTPSRRRTNATPTEDKVRWAREFR